MPRIVRCLKPEEARLFEDELGLSLLGRSFASQADFSAEELERFFSVARLLKAKQKRDEAHPLLAGKTLAMIFRKASTRTRVSFEVAMLQLSGHALFLGAQDLQLRRGETVADTARVLSRYVDGIMIRTFDHRDVLELAEHASIPVINGLTDYLHPCQALSDFFTVLELKGRLKGIKLVYVGDGNNMAHSLLLGGSKLGVNVTVCTPPGYRPDPEVVALAQGQARASGCRVELALDPSQAVGEADVIYTDVWASMGQEDEHQERLRAFAGFQVDAALVQEAKSDAVVMHCLPAHRGEEITDEVMDGPQSVVFHQAENRLHVQKAILALLIG